jgi:hypothetical protein
LTGEGVLPAVDVEEQRAVEGRRVAKCRFERARMARIGQAMKMTRLGKQVLGAVVRKRAVPEVVDKTGQKRAQ